MASRKPRPVAVTMAGVQGYPAITARKLPEPRWAHAIDEPGVLRTMVVRTARAIRTVGVGVLVFVAGLVPVTVWPNLGEFLNFTCVLTMLLGGAILLVGVARVIGAVVIWRMMRLHPWQVYTCTSMTIKEETRRVRMTVTNHQGAPFLIWVGASRRRREFLRGMSRPEVWLAGDPQREAVLTPAGGPDIFFARRATYAPARQPARRVGQRAPLPRPPKPVKPLTPKQRARAEARAQAAAAAKIARDKAYAAQRAKAVANQKAKKANPTSAAKPAVTATSKQTPTRQQPPKPRLLPRRGQKIKWMG